MHQSQAEIFQVYQAAKKEELRFAGH